MNIYITTLIFFLYLVVAEKCKMTHFHEMGVQNEIFRFLSYHSGTSFYVGGLNALYRLSFNNKWKLRERILWNGDKLTQNGCVMRGKSSIECGNYIRAFSISENILSICGTNGQIPRLSIRDMFNITIEKDNLDGKLYCSSDPRGIPTENSLVSPNKTILVSKNNGAYAPISVFSSKGISTDISTYEQLNTDAEVVGLVNHKKHIYIFLNEGDITEADGKIVPRIARICKNDLGYKGKWMSFVKIKVKCGDSNDFTQMRAISQLRLGNSLFIFIIFYTKKYDWLYNKRFSVLCVYKIEDIEQAFLESSLMEKTEFGCWTSLRNAFNIVGPLAMNLANCEGYDSKQRYINMHPILNTTVNGQLIFTQTNPPLSLFTKNNCKKI